MCTRTRRRRFSNVVQIDLFVLRTHTMDSTKCSRYSIDRLGEDRVNNLGQF